MERVYNCPLCNGEMKLIPGTQINANDGVTLYCPHRTCPAQEVFGHGQTDKQAWEIITQKYGRSKKD